MTITQRKIAAAILTITLPIWLVPAIFGLMFYNFYTWMYELLECENEQSNP